MTVWSLQDYCATQLLQQEESVVFPASTQSLIDQMALPSLHPFCAPNGPSFPAEGVPPMGGIKDPQSLFENESFLETIQTLWLTVGPSLLAVAELWLKFFAGLLGPFGVLYLLWNEGNVASQTGNYIFFSTTVVESPPQKETTSRRTILFLSVVCILTLASTLVLMTDSLYVLQNGPAFGMRFFASAVVLSLRVCWRHKMPKTSLCVAFMVLLSCHLTFDWQSQELIFGDKTQQVRIDEGLYFDNSNDVVKSIVDHWPKDDRTYDHQQLVTMTTGDARTAFPFMLNFYERDPPGKHRVFLQTEDQEYIALDMFFPPAGHNASRPTYFVLHGLNPITTEEYIRDLICRSLEEGSTVIVFVARGMMDLPIRGMSMFHGARLSDAHLAATTVRRALGPDQVMVGAGYSMGGIVLNNYIATYGTDCPLDGAISISGGLDVRYQEHHDRARRLWEPLLGASFRDKTLLKKYGQRLNERLPKETIHQLMRARYLSEIDEYTIVPLLGLESLTQYYEAVSALGDIPHTAAGRDGELEATSKGGKIHNVSIPLCVVHAFDDPLVSWRTVASNEGPMHPDNLVQTGSGNLMILLTRGGGHVGWPVSNLPTSEKWKWMSHAVMSFVRAVDEAKQQARRLERRS